MTRRIYLCLTWLICRWRNIQLALDNHRKRLDGALEVHAFNRDIDDINDRINEKVVCSQLSLRATK